MSWRSAAVKHSGGTGVRARRAIGSTARALPEYGLTEGQLWRHSVAPQLALGQAVLRERPLQLLAEARGRREGECRADADPHDGVAGRVDGREAGHRRGIGEAEQPPGEGRVELDQVGRVVQRPVRADDKGGQPGDGRRQRVEAVGGLHEGGGFDHRGRAPAGADPSTNKNRLGRASPAAPQPPAASAQRPGPALDQSA